MYFTIASTILASALLTFDDVTLAVQRAKQSASEPLSEFQFEAAGNKLFAQVRVNGSDPLWFVVDTGAAAMTIDRGCATRLGLELNDERKMHAGAGKGHTVLAAATRDVTFDVHGVQYKRTAVRVLPLDHVAEMIGRRVDGLLGADFIRRFVLEIDYATKTIRLYDPKTYEYSGSGREVPIDTSRNWAVAQCRVLNGDRQLIFANLVVDTGASNAVYFSRPFVERHGLIPAAGELASGVFGRGLGGASKGAIGHIDGLLLGPFLVSEPTAIFSQDTAGFFASPQFDGILGAQILQRCKTIFDYSNGRMILEPYGMPEPYEFDMSGLFIVAAAPEFRAFRVASVLPGTPAERAGIQEDDWILAIDGQDAGEMTLSEIRDLLKKGAGEKAPLTLLRGDERIDVILELERYAK